MTAAAEAGGPLVVEVERSGLVESAHLVDVAVAGRNGAIAAWAGDAATIAYLRSSAKPAQATACLGAGWRAPGDEQIAVACASHNGEADHVAAARKTLEAAGLSPDDLRCPSAWPARPGDASAAGAPAPLFHNCSGKHAAMLATCARNGWDLRTYEAPGHPMQLAVAAWMEDLAGRHARAAGIDGCGVPTFAFTLTEAAGIFARLPAAAGAALDAMAAYPHLVAGSERLCTAIIGSVPGLVVKIGAEGLICGVFRDRELGFALKSRDGTPRARDAAALRVLADLGAFGDRDPRYVIGDVVPHVTGGGAPVGEIRCLGSLERA